MSNIEFGVHFTEKRIQAASESVNDSFLYRAFDLDERWDERKEFFPEFAPVIDKIRQILRRRQEKFTPDNFEEKGKRHLEFSHFIHEQTGISHLLATEVLLNRSFGEELPVSLDDNSKTKLMKQADKIISESAGVALKSDNRSVTKFISMILSGDVEIEFEEDPVQDPRQMEFNI